MLKFEKLENGVRITDNEKIVIFPSGKLSASYLSESDSVQIRMMGSRKNLFSFNYKDVEIPSASSAEDAVSKISEIL